MCYNETIMTYITQLAQYTTTTTTSLTEDQAVALGAGLLLFVLLTFIFSAVLYVINAILLGRIFKKAGEPAWAAWVPFYNSWKMLEMGNQQGFWAILAIIPFVNIVSAVFLYIAMYHIGLKLGKSGGFVALGIFLPLVWIIWLAVDKSTWNEAASPGAVNPTNPSYPTPTPPTPPIAPTAV